MSHIVAQLEHIGQSLQKPIINTTSYNKSPLPTKQVLKLIKSRSKQLTSNQAWNLNIVSQLESQDAKNVCDIIRNKVIANSQLFISGQRRAQLTQIFCKLFPPAVPRNYAGLLLGPGGSQLKVFQQYTGCELAVRGENNEFHVTIKAPSLDKAYSAAKICADVFKNALLPDNQNRYKVAQLNLMRNQIPKIISKTSQDSNQNVQKDDEDQKRIDNCLEQSIKQSLNANSSKYIQSPPWSTVIPKMLQKLENALKINKYHIETLEATQFYYNCLEEAKKLVKYETNLEESDLRPPGME